MKKLDIIPFVYNDYDDLCSNTYIVIDNHSRCIVIDPSKDYNGIIDYINKHKLSLKGVFLTHTHFDHMRGVDRLIFCFKCPFYVGWNDIQALKNPNINGIENIVVNSEAIAVSEKDSFDCLAEEIRILDLPYHTIGSIGIYFEKSKILFSGDSLFKHSIGRYDFPTSSRKDKDNTLAKLMNLDEHTKVYPGHGPSTTIGEERKLNPFIKR